MRQLRVWRSSGRARHGHRDGQEAVSDLGGCLELDLGRMLIGELGKGPSRHTGQLYKSGPGSDVLQPPLSAGHPGLGLGVVARGILWEPGGLTPPRGPWRGDH